LINLAAPLVLSVIIAFAFGGLGGTALDIGTIETALVNLDAGATSNGQPINYGATITQIFIPSAADSATPAPTCTLVENATAQPPTGSLDDLLQVTLFESVADAQAAVDRGDYDAALIIPSDFSQQLTPQFTADAVSMGAATLEVYVNGASTLKGGILYSITQSITNQLLTGNVTIAATISTLIDKAQQDPAFGARFLLAQTTGSFQPDFACAFTPALNTITVNPQPLNEAQRQSLFVQILVSIGSAQAVFFALFSSLFGILSIYEEQKQGTYQRLVVAPIPRVSIVLGKLLGNFFNVISQIVLLLVGLTIVGSLGEGEFVFIWGNQPFLLLVLVVILSLSVSGFSVIVVGLARTPQQARIIGPVLNTGLGAIGGAFSIPLPPEVARLSPVYWASDAFRQLAAGNADIALNLLVLLVLGGIGFSLGAWLFNRRTAI
jgi:ABC-type multidrug transport system permease subunit